MKADKKKAGKIKPIKMVYYGFLALIGLGILLLITNTVYAYSYRGKVLINSYLLDKNISGYKDEKLTNFISDADSNYKDKKIKLVCGDKNWEIGYEDFNWQLDKDGTKKKILDYGHLGGFFLRAGETLKSIIIPKHYDLEYSFNESVLLDWLGQINQEIGQPKEETNIIIKDSSVKITEAKSGEKINEDEIRSQILDRLALKAKGDISIKLIKDDPVITKEEAEKLVDRAKSLTDHSVELKGPNGSIELSSNDLGSLIELKKKTRKIAFLKTELGEAYVSFNSKKIKEILNKESDALNIYAEDAKFSISNGKITLNSPSKTGKEIKLDESVDVAVEGLEKGEREITLPSKTQEPSIEAQTSADIEKIGIKEIIGTATTDFRKSPENRIHNIQMGVKYISGAVVKPGDEFSTISRLGKIDQSSGYLPELVIKENSTVPEFGGGLCQVSTTLFRSAMNSGLKITERQNHSYRVSYYEPPVGMDATIYYPRPDFRFVNTTDNYILINGHVEGTQITFDIYGTKDGREVSISDPSVYDITNPPEAIYIDDPALEAGEVKQTDHAHPGAKASFTYTVKKNGKTINQQTFNSAYVAWPAKFLRGPQAQEENQSQPTDEATPAPSSTPNATQTTQNGPPTP